MPMTIEEIEPYKCESGQKSPNRLVVVEDGCAEGKFFPYGNFVNWNQIDNPWVASRRQAIFGRIDELVSWTNWSGDCQAGGLVVCLPFDYNGWFNRLLLEWRRQHTSPVGDFHVCLDDLLASRNIKLSGYLVTNANIGRNNYRESLTTSCRTRNFNMWEPAWVDEIFVISAHPTGELHAAAFRLGYHDPDEDITSEELDDMIASLGPRH